MCGLFEKDKYLYFAKWQTLHTNFESTFIKGKVECKVFMHYKDICPNLKCQMAWSGRVIEFELELELHTILFVMTK